MKVECRYFGAVMITVGSWFSADDLQDKGGGVVFSVTQPFMIGW